MILLSQWRRLLLIALFAVGVFMAFSPAQTAPAVSAKPTIVTPTPASTSPATPAAKVPASKQSAKPVGEVVWVKGVIQAVGADGQSRTLKRKDTIYEHDTLNSSAGSEGQIVFSDSGLLALRENTVFRIDQYKYNKQGAPADNKYVANLVKGGFRTITGAISKGHPENYQLNTPVATIGVRGTQYSAYCGGDKAKGCQYKLEAGAISVGNDNGTLTLNMDKPYGEVPTARSAPVPLANAPDIFTTDPTLVPAQPSAKLVNETTNTNNSSSTPNSVVPGGPTGTGTGGTGTGSGGSSPAGGSKTVSGFCIS